jgi:hypothetical protein
MYVGPDLCRSLTHTCHAFASCRSTAGSFECECLEGYAGDGTRCEHVCGDGLRVPGEQVLSLLALLVQKYKY